MGRGVRDRERQTQTWWRHQIEPFPALLSMCGEFAGHRWIPLTKPSDAELWICVWCEYKRLSKQSWGWWFETPSRSLWRHCDDTQSHGVETLWERMIRCLTYKKSLHTFHTRRWKYSKYDLGVFVMELSHTFAWHCWIEYEYEDIEGK